jgi:uncharacterized protein (DUF1015 family)
VLIGWRVCHAKCQPVAVPRFEPFRALRYSPTLDLNLVGAPPYDVLSDADVDALCDRHPNNIVHVDVPRERDGDERYRMAAQMLQRWHHDGVLQRDLTPSFTLYRMEFVDATGAHRRTVGVLGALEVVDEGAGGVLPHERTTPKAKTDRLDLTRNTHTNLSPVWGLSLTAGLTALLDAPGELLGTCVDEAGVTHSVERVDNPARVAEIAEAVGRNPVLIADGHHRYAISRTFRDEVRQRSGAATDAELTLTYVAELVESQLSIDAIHRLFTGTTAEQLGANLDEYFRRTPSGKIDASFAAQVVERGALCLVHRDGTGEWLTPRPEAFEGVRSLDGALLEHALADVDVDVMYQHGVDHVVKAVRAGRADCAVLIRPTSITEIRRTADERLLMPPKSTFFTPKLRTGPVLRPLDGL